MKKRLKTSYLKSNNFYLLLTITLLMFTGVLTIPKLSFSNDSRVLGDNNENESKSGEDDNNEKDKNEDEKEDLEEDQPEKSSKKKESEDKVQLEKKYKVENKSTKEIKNKIEISKKEDDKNEDKPVISVIKNTDGTTTKTIKESERGKEKTTIITYDANGKIINKVESEDEESDEGNKNELISTVTNSDGTVTKTVKKIEGNKEEIKTYTYDSNGVLIKKSELNSDGIEKAGETILDSENDEKDNNSDTIPEDHKNESEIIFSFKPSPQVTLEPTEIKIINAKLEQELKNDKRIGGTVNKIELEVKTVNGEIKYTGTANSAEKLFGIFNISVKSDIEIDPATGQITAVNQSFWNKIVDFISF